MDDPNQVALKIIDMRAYANAFREIERATEAKAKQPSGGAYEEVYLLRHEIVKEDRSRE